MRPGLLFPPWVSTSLPFLFSPQHFLSWVCVSVCLVSAAGMSIILGVAEGEVFVNDAEIQKSALQVSR